MACLTLHWVRNEERQSAFFYFTHSYSYKSVNIGYLGLSEFIISTEIVQRRKAALGLLQVLNDYRRKVWARNTLHRKPFDVTCSMLLTLANRVYRGIWEVAMFYHLPLWLKCLWLKPPVIQPQCNTPSIKIPLWEVMCAWYQKYPLTHSPELFYLTQLCYAFLSASFTLAKCQLFQISILHAASLY